MSTYLLQPPTLTLKAFTLENGWFGKVPFATRPLALKLGREETYGEIGPLCQINRGMFKGAGLNWMVYPPRTTQWLSGDQAKPTRGPKSLLSVVTNGARELNLRRLLMGWPKFSFAVTVGLHVRKTLRDHQSPGGPRPGRRLAGKVAKAGNIEECSIKSVNIESKIPRRATDIAVIADKIGPDFQIVLSVRERVIVLDLVGIAGRQTGPRVASQVEAPACRRESGAKSTKEIVHQGGGVGIAHSGRLLKWTELLRDAAVGEAEFVQCVDPVIAMVRQHALGALFAQRPPFGEQPEIGKSRLASGS